MTRRPLRAVLFAAAAGPRRGFGHLVRCGVLARALGVPLVVALRASASTRRAARRLGWIVHPPALDLLDSLAPDLLVIDDPSARHAAPWVRAARARAIRVAAVQDLGLGRVPADLTIDGSPTLVRGAAPADLQGPSFAVLDPSIAALRARRPTRARGRMLIALGGGAHVRGLGADIAAALLRARPGLAIDLAAGFGSAARRPGLPAGAYWLHAPRGLARPLASASAAIVAGGVTLYEACALGTPVVAVAVVPAQRPTIDAFVVAGAVVDATARRRADTVRRAVAAALRLLDQPHLADRQARRASQFVDGRGAWRVASRLIALVGDAPVEGRADVA